MPNSQLSPDPDFNHQCQHINYRGHRCRMLIYDGQGLCHFHFTRLQAEKAKSDQAVAAALLRDIDDFCSADSVNLFLGNLLKEMVHKRIDRRDAIAQAYVCQLLLNTFPHIQREVEAETDRQGCEELLKGFLASRRASLSEKDPGDSGGSSSVSIPLYPADGSRDERG